MENEVKTNTKLIRAEERGHADHGWLKARHTFSFAGFYKPENTRFGLLRVFNDDIIEGGMGFGTHPHDNMEIVTIPLEGALEHKDSMGHTSVITPGEVQVMSAGSGITHSEYNHHQDKPAKVLQIWVFPKYRNVEPRYDQKKFDQKGQKNQWQTLVSPDKDHESALWLHQDVWFEIGQFDSGTEVDYQPKRQENGVWFFIIEGTANINGITLNKRDSLGVETGENIPVKIKEKAHILAIDVPMNQ